MSSRTRRQSDDSPLGLEAVADRPRATRRAEPASAGAPSKSGCPLNLVGGGEMCFSGASLRAPARETAARSRRITITRGRMRLGSFGERVIALAVGALACGVWARDAAAAEHEATERPWMNAALSPD